MGTPSEPNTKLAHGEAKYHKTEEEEYGFLFASQLASSITISMALRLVIELGVFDIIAKAGEGARLSAKDIAVEIGTNNPEAPTMLDRLLTLLASHSLLHCTVLEDPQYNGLPQRLYGLSPAAKYFVPDADGVSLAPLLALSTHNVCCQSWIELKGAVLEGGIPFNKVHGMHAFEYAKVDPRFNEVINQAMVTSDTIIIKRILESYKGFEHINRLVDIGGGLGTNLKLITSKYPNVHGINFDLPHVIEHAPIYAGVEHVGGDMFKSIPNGDAILMKRILHNWTDEDCLKLLKNCYNAIPDDGKVIVEDSILPIVPETTATAKTLFSFDVAMMTNTPGGKERTQQEFMELAKGSGFSGIKFVCCVSGLWLMEFFK